MNSSLAEPTVPLGVFLRELTEMTDQLDGPVPVLELLLGDVTVKASVETGREEFLQLLALLPKSDKSHYSPHAPASPNEDIEFLWHSDEGRYIAVRRIAATAFADERDVMDAILAMADDAGAWFYNLQLAAQMR